MDLMMPSAQGSLITVFISIPFAAKYQAQDEG
jgi:hypothetical protein